MNYDPLTTPLEDADLPTRDARSALPLAELAELAARIESRPVHTVEWKHRKRPPAWLPTLSYAAILAGLGLLAFAVYLAIR